MNVRQGDTCHMPGLHTCVAVITGVADLPQKVSVAVVR